jgi:tetratricopeptide (TPR) repeat protein
MQQHYSSSIPYLKKLTQLEPDYLFGWLALSDSCLRAGRKEEAAEAARKAAAVAPSSADAWLQLARTEREVGHMEAALRALSRGAEVSPDSAAILATVGFGYINLNRLREAIPPLERAARMAPKDYLIHAQLGYCLQASADGNEPGPEELCAGVGTSRPRLSTERHASGCRESFRARRADHAELWPGLAASGGRISRTGTRCGREQRPGARAFRAGAEEAQNVGRPRLKFLAPLG